MSSALQGKAGGASPQVSGMLRSEALGWQGEANLQDASTLRFGER